MAAPTRRRGEPRRRGVGGRAGGSRAAAFEVNALGVSNLLEAVAEQRPSAHVLCVSSGEVYGDGRRDQLPLTEDRPSSRSTPTRPARRRWSSSAASTRAAPGWDQRHAGLQPPRPGPVGRFAASSFARQIAEAEARGGADAWLRTGDLTPERDFSDVRDIVRAYVLLSSRELTGTFNVCSGSRRPLREPGRAARARADPGVETEVDERACAREAQAIYGSLERLHGGDRLGAASSRSTGRWATSWRLVARGWRL